MVFEALRARRKFEHKPAKEQKEKICLKKSPKAFFPRR